MKAKKLFIICATLACLILTLHAFGEEQQSFIRKVLRGGPVTQSIQTRDGNYVYLNDSHSNYGRVNGGKLTKVNKPSAKSISEVSLTFYIDFYTSVSLNGIAQTLDGFVLVGFQQYGGANGIVVKTNEDGRVIWSKQFSPNISGINPVLSFDSVIPTADGGFIVTGRRGELRTPVYPVVIKFSSRGDVLWSKSFDHLSSFYQSAPTLDGGVILAADLIGSDQKSIGVNVIKIDGAGNLMWAVTLEMKEFSVHSLTALSDQRYLLAGKASNTNKLLLVRLNADGGLHSKAAYSLDAPDFFVSSLGQALDGGIAIAGDLQKQTGSALDGFLVKINDRLALILQKRLGFPDSEETITSVIVKEDGSYLLFGSIDSDTLFVGLNSDGLAAGCGFSHDLIATKVLFGNVNRKRLAITPNTFSPNVYKLDVTSKRLDRRISDVCAN